MPKLSRNEKYSRSTLQLWAFMEKLKGGDFSSYLLKEKRDRTFLPTRDEDVCAIYGGCACLMLIYF